MPPDRIIAVEGCVSGRYSPSRPLVSHDVCSTTAETTMRETLTWGKGTPDWTGGAGLMVVFLASRIQVRLAFHRQLHRQFLLRKRIARSGVEQDMCEAVELLVQRLNTRLAPALQAEPR
jgi:hypothetical protein